jgi:hypothetical protein
VTDHQAIGQLTSGRVTALASRGSALAPGRALVLRLALHLAVWAPFVAGVVEEIRLRWRPVGDGAAIALRAWDSLTAHGPLVGQATQLAHAVYDPGPLEYWLLAIPVHIDPRYGVVWGAALWCVIAASLAIEAAWSALGGLGGFISAAVILGTVAWQPMIALQPFWNPWFGVMFFLAALAASWAVLCGNRWWWVALVVAGSVASQAHLMYALPCVALVVVTLVVGLVDSLRAKSGYWWALAGLVVGLGCWAGPFIQQFTGRPGNLTALLHGQGSGPLSGAAFGFKTLTASILPPPLWWTASDQLHGLPAIHRIDDRSAGFAVVALIVIAAVLIIAVRPLRSRRLAALAAVSLLVSVAALVTYSRIPVISPNLITLDYLDIIMFPLGVLAWLVVGSAVVVAGRRLISRRRAASAAPGVAAPGVAAPGTAAAGAAAPAAPASGSAAAPEIPVTPAAAPSGTAAPAARGTPASRPRAGWTARAATLAAVVLIALTSFLAVAQQGSVGDAGLAGVLSLASQRVERALPRQPIALYVSDIQSTEQRRLVLGLVWMLRVAGYRPQVRAGDARELGPEYVFRHQPLPRVTVHVRGSDVSVHVTRPGPANLTPAAG